MTTIIERPTGDSGSGGTVLIALVVGAIAAAVIGLFAFGAFDNRGPSTTSVTVEQPVVPTQSAPATTPPSQNAAPSTEPPASTPATPDAQPATRAEPTAPPPPVQ